MFVINIADRFATFILGETAHLENNDQPSGNRKTSWKWLELNTKQIKINDEQAPSETDSENQ